MSSQNLSSRRLPTGHQPENPEGDDEPVQVDLHFASQAPRQRAWLASLLPRLQDDAALTAGWLSGSFARAEADAYSDVNLHLAVRAERWEAAQQRLPHHLRNVQPLAWLRATVEEAGLRLRLVGLTASPGQNIVNANRPGGVRFTVDCTVESAGPDLWAPMGAIRRLFGSLPALVDAQQNESFLQASHPERVQQLLETFWWLLARLPAQINRGEELAAAANLHRLRTLLTELVVAFNGAQQPPFPARINQFLGDSQQEAFEKTLLTKSVGRTAWIGQAVALVVLYRWYAPQLATLYDLIYPTELEETVLALLDRDVADWPAQIKTG